MKKQCSVLFLLTVSLMSVAVFAEKEDPKATADHMLSSFDTNKDDFLSIKEAPVKFKIFGFKHADKNHDKKLERGELVDYYTQLRTRGM